MSLASAVAPTLLNGQQQRQDTSEVGTTADTLGIGVPRADVGSYRVFGPDDQHCGLRIADCGLRVADGRTHTTGCARLLEANAQAAGGRQRRRRRRRRFAGGFGSEADFVSDPQRPATGAGRRAGVARGRRSTRAEASSHFCFDSSQRLTTWNWIQFPPLAPSLDSSTTVSVFRSRCP